MNTAPTWVSQSSMSSRTTNSMKITATAKDDEQTTLTYKLYWSTSSTLPTTPTATITGNSNSAIEFNRKGLTQYTTYYWRIDVSDGTADDVQGTPTSNRTYCSGTGLTCSSRYASDTLQELWRRSVW